MIEFSPRGGGTIVMTAGVALVLDLALGDPPGRWHPVAWMGTFLDRARSAAPKDGRWCPFLAGALVVVVGVGGCAVAGLLLTRFGRALPIPLDLLVEGAALKLTLSVRGLAAAAGEVRTALAAGDLPGARRLLSWHLVSRDTTSLDAAHVAAAAIESVAENASDSAVAPLVWYAVGGLPAAFAYRFVNTADAMLGYRDPDREWLGKCAARLDDGLNLVPSRLTAALMLSLGWLDGGQFAPAWRVWWRDSLKTASPNAGHPMAAAAGVLGVELEKAGAYVLGAGQRLPRAADIGRAVRLLGLTVAGLLGLMAAGGILWGARQ